MENIEAMLCAYVEGDLDAAGRAQIEKHLQDHPQHRKLLEELMGMRELVRGLPRARAPMDVGDSLRQKVERSMLLEDPVVAAQSGQRVDRWPQFFGIAAIFLLVASLCFILYKALGPTWKPAVFTQSVADRLPDDNALNGVAVDQLAAPGSVAAANGRQAPVAESVQGPVITTAALPAPEAVLQKAQQLMVKSQQQVLSVAQLDVEAIRRRLESSGYGIHGGGGGSAAGSGPVLVVVDSSNLSATKAQINQFLTSNAGISWNAVPAESAVKPAPATLPSGAVADVQLAQAQNVMDGKRMLDMSDGANGPSSDLYVVRGLTPERADALRQVLTVPGNGPEVQVTVQPGEGLATTQPSAEAEKAPTSQPAGNMNFALSMAPAATTAPSGGVMMMNNNAGALRANQSQSLPPVDAVIVLQTAGPAAPTTQPMGQPIGAGAPATTQP